MAVLKYQQISNRLDDIFGRNCSLINTNGVQIFKFFLMPPAGMMTNRLFVYLAFNLLFSSHVSFPWRSMFTFHLTPSNPAWNPVYPHNLELHNRLDLPGL